MSIYIEQRNASFIFTDINNNQFSDTSEGIDAFEAAEKYNLQICFKLNKNLEFEDLHSPDQNSIVFKNNGSIFTLYNEIDRLLPILRQIEDISFQLIAGKMLHRNDLVLIESLYEIKDKVRDGHLSAKKYDQIISKWQKEYPHISKAFL